MPWSHPSASTRVAVQPKIRRCKPIILDAQKLLLLLAMAELLVQVAAAAFLGQIPSWPTPLTPTGTRSYGGRMAS